MRKHFNIADIRALRQERQERNERKIGSRMDDDTIYAGISSSGHEIFVMPYDLPLGMSFNEVASYIKNDLNKRKELGHDDWKIPSEQDLNTIYRHKNKGSFSGSFMEGTDNGSALSAWYWTTSGFLSSPEHRLCVRFKDGASTTQHEDTSGIRCRLIRYEKPKA